MPSWACRSSALGESRRRLQLVRRLARLVVVLAEQRGEAVRRVCLRVVVGEQRDQAVRQRLELGGPLRRGRCRGGRGPEQALDLADLHLLPLSARAGRPPEVCSPARWATARQYQREGGAPCALRDDDRSWPSRRWRRSPRRPPPRPPPNIPASSPPPPPP